MVMQSRVWVGLFVFLAAFVNFQVVGRSILDFPYLSFDPDQITGLAIVNPNETDALVVFSAFNTEGTLLEAEGLQNPVSVTVGAGEQYAITVKALFAGKVAAETVAWCQATSEADDLTGFFLALDSEITFLDGADLPESSSAVIFNEVRADGGYTTELNMINPNEESTEVTLELAGSENPAMKRINLPPNGILRLDVEELFGEVPLEGSAHSAGYIEAQATTQIIGFEIVRAPGDLIGLNARPGDQSMTTLYFPQFAVLGGIETSLAVVNRGDKATILTLTAHDSDGNLYDSEDLKTNPVSRFLNAGEALREDLETMFGFEGGSLRDGWLEVTSTSASIDGTLSYSVPSINSRAAVSTTSQGTSRAVFSHIATTLGFFTGVAILNAGSLSANVKVAAFLPDGSQIGSFVTALRPGQRISKLIDELIPESAGQAGGVIWVKTDLPVYLTSLFGSATGVLANIPPQPVPSEYSPDQAEASLRIDPLLAVVRPGAKQVFHLAGTSSSADWGVNGISGGSEAVGFISSAGSYSAPTEIPSALPITVTATVEHSIAGASVDVLSPQALLSGLGQVQSVAFLEGLQKLFTAELASTAAPGASGSLAASAGDESSTVFDVTSKVPVPKASYPGEKIAKMIAFDAVDGREYLLLAGQTNGRIIRLDPEDGESVDVVTGLNQPNALVIDSVDGSLLIAEEDQVSSVSSSDLNQGLSPAAFPKPSAIPRPGRVFDNAGGRVAVNLCNGNIFVSLPRQGEILEFVRATGALRLVASGLQDPGQILGFYRRGISCPASFHLLVVERGLDQVTLVVPSDGTIQRWIDLADVTDVIFLPQQNPFAKTSGVLLSGSSGELSFVKMPSLYLPRSVNPLRRVPLNPCRLVQITATEEGQNGMPALSRDGSSLAFISSADPFGKNSDGNFELFVADVSTGEIRQVTESLTGGNSHPAVSSDGSLIVFASDADLIQGESPKAGIYFLRPGQGIVDYLLAMPLNPPGLDAAGMRMVFDSKADLTGENRDRNSEVFLYETGTRELRQLTASKESGSRYPAISGDGRVIVFRSTADLTGENPDGYSALFTYEVDSDTYHFVAFESLSPSIPATRPPIMISGDASHIVFFSDQDLVGRNPGGDDVIYLFDADIHSFTQISKPNARPIQLGPLSWDGGIIAFSSLGNPVGTNRDGNPEIFLLNLSEMSFTQVSRSRRSVNRNTSLSGDGTRVVFESDADYTARNGDRNSELFLSVCKPD